MAKNFAIAQKVLETLENRWPFKFKYNHSRLQNIAPGDIADIISVYLEIKEQEKNKKSKLKPKHLLKRGKK